MWSSSGEKNGKTLILRVYLSVFSSPKSDPKSTSLIIIYENQPLLLG